MFEIQAETTVYVNGGRTNITPNDGETVAQLVKRVGKENGLKTVDVYVEGTEVNQGDYRANEPASQYDEIKISRHTTVGQ